MEFKKTVYSVQDGIAVITMNYMKNLNAIDEQMADELLELFARAEADEAVKVVVLKGADKAFSAGGDIGFFYQQVQAGGDVSLDDLIARVGKLADYMKKMSKMIITAVSGAAAGAGVSLALGGDFLTADMVRRQIWLFVLMVVFCIVYVAIRYQCQQDMLTIDKLEKELLDAKYKALSSSSTLTEKCRESHVLDALKQNKDSLLHVADQPPYIINVAE